MKNNKNIYLAFENLVIDIFPDQDVQFHREFAHRLTNFADHWDKYYGICESNIQNEQDRTIRWIKRELKKSS